MANTGWIRVSMALWCIACMSIPSVYAAPVNDSMDDAAFAGGVGSTGVPTPSYLPPPSFSTLPSPHMGGIPHPAPAWAIRPCAVLPSDGTMLVSLSMFTWPGITPPASALHDPQLDGSVRVSAGHTVVFPIPQATGLMDAVATIVAGLHAQVLGTALVSVQPGVVAQPVAVGGGAELTASWKGFMGDGQQSYQFVLRGHDPKEHRIHVRGQFCGNVGDAWIVHDDFIGILGVVVPG